MQGLDWVIFALFITIALVIGLWSARKSSHSAEEFFLSGRQMPWWLLGISIVATTFSSDTPNLVTNIVRQHGVSGNWMWWAFLLTGMLTVFVYARLWRRSGIVTDLGFYELRYGGKAASFLRGFRAVYLGVVFNIIIMATVMLAGIKIGGVLLGWSPLKTVLIAGSVTTIYATIGGLRGVLWTDLVMFFMAMAGAVAAAWFALDHPAVNGLSGLQTYFEGSNTLNLLPNFQDPSVYIPLFLIPIAIQWWSVWYSGSEPGGGGYTAQRILAAKNERHALGAVLLFNIAHYAIRPWPWIIVALASMIVYPDLVSMQTAFPGVDPKVIQDDFAYPAMLTLMPKGWLGLAATSLIAAFMSTISTHLNWGASYLVHDVYLRYFNRDATPQKQVAIARWATVGIMIPAILLSLLLDSALEAFGIILQIGAGTGLIYILRWFWWRINAWTEISAMIISFGVALFFTFIYPRIDGLPTLASHEILVWSVGLTTLGWLAVTFMTRPESQEVLWAFYKQIRPAAMGWRPVIALAGKTGSLNEVNEGQLPLQLLAMSVGCLLVFGILFTTGNLLYGRYEAMVAPLIVTLSSGVVLVYLVRRIFKAE